MSGPLGIEDISPSMSPDDKSFTRIVPRVPDSTKRMDAGSNALRRSDSPEIPFQAATGSSDGLDASSPGNSFVGLRVVAKWSSNGYFYSGKITRDVGAGKYKLLFDDGYECDVLGKDILLCDPIPLDTEVTALSEDEYFSAGNQTGRVPADVLCLSVHPVRSYQDIAPQLYCFSGSLQSEIPLLLHWLSLPLTFLFVTWFSVNLFWNNYRIKRKICQVQNGARMEDSCVLLTQCSLSVIFKISLIYLSETRSRS